MAAITSIISFLLISAFSVATLLLIVRLLMHAYRVDRHATATELVANFTNPVINPIKGMLPKIPRIELATLVVLIVVECLKYIVVGLLSGHMINPIHLIILVPADIIMQICWLLFYIVLFDVVISWVAPQLESPAIDFVRMLAKPTTDLARYVMSDKSGFDFSPWAALIVLKVIQLIITAYIPPGYFF